MRQVVLYDGDACTVDARESASDAVAYSVPQTAEAQGDEPSAEAHGVPQSATAASDPAKAAAVHKGWLVEAVAAGSVGVTDYGELTGKPSIEGVTLQGDKSFEDLGLVELTNAQILEIWNRTIGA